MGRLVKEQHKRHYSPHNDRDVCRHGDKHDIADKDKANEKRRVPYAKKTQAEEVINSFEASFADKQVIPRELEIEWLEKAVGRYSIELEPIVFHKDIDMFDTKLDRYVIDTLAQFMYQSYQERQVSLVNKRVSIVGKDISIDGSNGTKTAERAHLEYVERKASDMVENQKPSAYI